MNVVKCPYCEHKNIIKKGKRKTKYTLKQIFYCKSCKKYFVDKELPGKTYPATVVINAVNYYNLGYTFKETSSLINRRFKVKTSKSSIKRWVSEYSNVCSFNKIRKQVFKDYKKGDVVFTKSFKHQGLEYIFKYHKAKLEQKRLLFSGLFYYLKSLEKDLRNDFFDGGTRCSQTNFKINFKVDIKKFSKKNQACHLCQLASYSVSNNRKKHEIIEDFMLLNDIATVACEVPVWFWDKELDTGISGHIDLLQIRSGKIYVLDLKPDAKHENEQKVVSQLYLYARGLSYRTGIPLKIFRCAWFDENDYYEFLPSKLQSIKFCRQKI